MKTAQMYIEAQKGGTFKSVKGTMYYNEKYGFTDENKKKWSPQSFATHSDDNGNYGLVAFMEVEWEEVILTIFDLLPSKIYTISGCGRYKVDSHKQLFIYDSREERFVKCDYLFNDVINLRFKEVK